MAPMKNRQHAPAAGPVYFRIGLALLVVAVVAILGPILATAAQPYVVWLFSTSYGAIGLVLGLTLIRVSHHGPCVPNRIGRCRS
jgi:hypothetical protein